VRRGSSRALRFLRRDYCSRAGARFCSKCGKPLELDSAAAPANPPPTAPISPATPPASSAEHRQVTVMFCDLVASTNLSRQLNAEDYRDFIRSYQDVCAGVVTRFDGFIAKFMGDGVLASFRLAAGARGRRGAGDQYGTGGLGRRTILATRFRRSASRRAAPPGGRRSPPIATRSRKGPASACRSNGPPARAIKGLRSCCSPSEERISR
jgi:class 3 adenylate cyclase